MLNPGSGNSGKPHDDITLSQPIKTAARQQNLHSRPSAPKIAEHSPSTHNHSNLPRRQDVHCRTRHAKASAAAGALGSARSKVAPELAPQALVHSKIWVLLGFYWGYIWGYTGVLLGFILGFYWGSIGVLLGLYLGLYWGSIGVYIGVLLGLYWGYLLLLIFGPFPSADTECQAGKASPGKKIAFLLIQVWGLGLKVFCKGFAALRLDKNGEVTIKSSGSRASEFRLWRRCVVRLFT